MTNPSWLDEERRLTQVYRPEPPASLCPCAWERHHEPGEPQADAVWVLTQRKAGCPIHGRNGTH